MNKATKFRVKRLDFHPLLDVDGATLCLSEWELTNGHLETLESGCEIPIAEIRAHYDPEDLMPVRNLRKFERALVWDVRWERYVWVRFMGAGA